MKIRAASLLTIALALLATAGAYAVGGEPDLSRQSEIARKGADVMPFDLEKTLHVFTKTEHGGLQQVTAKDAADRDQIGLIRRHLQDLAVRFGRGDFSGPAAIHGDAMPGLARLRAAQPGELTVIYGELADGAELRYSSRSPESVGAIHDFFDAQLSDHGGHAQAGHARHHTPAGR